MSLHTFPAALPLTPAQLAEARRIVSVEARTAEDVARRPLARQAAWSGLRHARLLANARRLATTPAPGGGDAA